MAPGQIGQILEFGFGAPFTFRQLDLLQAHRTQGRGQLPAAAG